MWDVPKETQMQTGERQEQVLAGLSKPHQPRDTSLSVWNNFTASSGKLPSFLFRKLFF